MGSKRYIQAALLVALVVAVQVATKWAGKPFFLTQLTMSAYYLLVIMGLCVLMGYAGQISIGHAGFFAMGGYISAALCARDYIKIKDSALIDTFSSMGLMVQREDLYGAQMLSFHPWAALVVAVTATAVVAYLIGGPVLKLKGHYLAMATLGFGVIVYRVAIGTQFLGQADGITDVPPLPLPFGLQVSGEMDMRLQNYYIAWGTVLVGFLLLLNLIDSRVGRALRAIHGSQEAANSSGIDTARYKLNIFVLSAVYAAVAGVLLTHYNTGIGPSEASIIKSVRYVAIVAVGGMANLWGALIMGLVLNFLSLRGYFGTYDDAVFGGILIVIMLFAPHGISLGWITQRVKAMFGRGKKVDEQEPEGDF